VDKAGWTVFFGQKSCLTAMRLVDRHLAGMAKHGHYQEFRCKGLGRPSGVPSKGPWRAVTNPRGVAILDPQRNEICLLPAQGACVAPPGYVTPYQAVEANGALISAAPELLAIAEERVEEFWRPRSPKPGICGRRPPPRRCTYFPARSRAAQK
jgi:hypothetical protein